MQAQASRATCRGRSLRYQELRPYPRKLRGGLVHRVSPVQHVNEGVLIGDGVGDQLLFLKRDTSTSCVPVAVAIIHVFLSAPTIYSVDVMFGMETDSLGNRTVLFIS
jgi:hypothetical protein